MLPAGQAVQAAGLGFVIGAGNQNLIALDLDGHEGMIVGIQAALGALDGDAVCCLIDSDSNAGRNDDGFSFQFSTLSFTPFLPHKGQDLAANVRSTSSLIGHDALRGGNDCGAQPFMTFGISSQLV